MATEHDRRGWHNFCPCHGTRYWINAGDSHRPAKRWKTADAEELLDCYDPKKKTEERDAA